MLGIICVPGTPPRWKPVDGSTPDAAGTAEAAEIDPAEGRLTDGGAGAEPPRADAAAYASRRESTLLTARGETCGAALGSPIPGAVVASSGETDNGAGAGGGP